MKTMTNNNWFQDDVIHCPGKECKGMLLNNDFKHYHKCSDCNEEYIQIVEYKKRVNKRD